MLTQIRIALRALAILGCLALIGSVIGTVLGKLALSLNPIGQTLSNGLFICGGIWTLLMLLGMILTAQGGMGEYFWLGTPLTTAAALSIRLTANPDADFPGVMAYAALGSLCLYGVAASIHILSRSLIARRETVRR